MHGSQPILRRSRMRRGSSDMSLTEPPTLTVGDLRSWLAPLPDDAVLVVDNQASGFAWQPSAINGPWRAQGNAGWLLRGLLARRIPKKIRGVSRERDARREPFDSHPFGVFLIRPA